MSDTIFALSSGALPAGVAVIRLSGRESLGIVQRLIGGAELPSPRTAMLRSIIDPASMQTLDLALVIAFPAPHSFTGEDVAEIHCHGSIAVVAAMQHALAGCGARPAEAGEFTRRAFESGRIDLTQAEALADSDRGGNRGPAGTGAQPGRRPAARSGGPVARASCHPDGRDGGRARFCR
jgi:tRNA modification GTPase